MLITRRLMLPAYQLCDGEHLPLVVLQHLTLSLLLLEKHVGGLLLWRQRTSLGRSALRVTSLRVGPGFPLRAFRLRFCRWQAAPSPARGGG